MAMLFKVTDAPLRDDNDGLDAISEFIGVSDRNLKWVFLVYDYDTPYKQLPMQKRKERVASRLGFRLEKDGKRFNRPARVVIGGTNKQVNDATEAFKMLIYDDDRETYQSVCDLITNIRDYIREKSTSSGDYQKKMVMAEKLPKLEETKKSLAQILDIRTERVDESEENTADEGLSTLDKVNQGLL